VTIDQLMQTALRKHQDGRLAEAEALYRQVLTQQPDHADALHFLGVAAHQEGRNEPAEALIRRAIALRPGYAEAYSNLGAVLTQQGKLDEAVSAYRDAIRCKPGHAQAYANLGAALSVQGKLDEAAAACRQAIALMPGFAEAHSNLGAALKESGRFTEAVAAYEQAIRLKPDHAEAHFNLALTLLLLGDFSRGWQEYEWRWKARGFLSPKRNFDQPLWGGEQLNGRRILLHAEQGLGDTIQFVRYAAQVSARGGKVVLECQPELHRLLEQLPGVSLVAAGGPLPDFDLHCPLLSLGRAFATKLESIPNPVPYLSADPRLVDRWASRVTGGETKVGLVWAGKATHPNDRNRSMRLRQFLPLAKVQGVRFYSLQAGPAARHAVTGPPGLEVADLSDALSDLAETAAAIANLDLVISVDTAVAHLAGAMGKPVWVLLSFIPDWRWLLDRDDSPWYPTARLFRQKAIGRWDEVIDRVAECLVSTNTTRQSRKSR